MSLVGIWVKTILVGFINSLAGHSSLSGLSRVGGSGDSATYIFDLHVYLLLRGFLFRDSYTRLKIVYFSREFEYNKIGLIEDVFIFWFDEMIDSAVTNQIVEDIKPLFA